MVSRLDRLFILLDTGSNESIRFAAAKQLGEVQKVQPNDLDYLLQRIKEYSGKSVWETRVAAGQATKCVLEQVGPWPPAAAENYDNKSILQLQIEAEKLIEQKVNTDKILQGFELEWIVSQCPKLLSLDISDVDDANQASPSGSKASTRGRGRKESTSKASLRKKEQERLILQRKLINKELGIPMGLNLGVQSTDIVSNDDLQANYEASPDQSQQSSAKKQPNSQQDDRIITSLIHNYDEILGLLREQNLITKNENQDDMTGPSVNSSGEPSSFNRCLNEWPLTIIAKQYTNDLFHSSWEIRHGAAIALREIVKLQGNSAGKRSDLSSRANELMNQLWLSDMALKAISVLALDKFGDFLFDQVVAPVRENAAQLLGCCVAHMSESNARSTIRIILGMLENPNWETRHGGILGLKYALNVAKEAYKKRILEDSFEPIFKCLGDSVDDVSAEAAAALVPVKDLMIETIPDKAPKLINFLWEHLASIDELTTSTSNIVLLLASLVTSDSTTLNSSELQNSIPRLWSLFGHSSTSVRVSVVKALITLIEAQKTNCTSWMPEALLTTALRLVFQRTILENMDEVRPYLERVWMLLVKIDSNDATVSTMERFNLLKCTSRYLNYWLCLVMQPSNSPIDRGSPMWLKIEADGSETDVKPDGEVYLGSMTFNAETMNQQKLQVTKCRLLGSKLLGALYSNLVNDSPSDNSEFQHSKDTLKYLSEMFVHYLKTKSANQKTISGWTIESWARHHVQLLQKPDEINAFLPKTLADNLNSSIQEASLFYDELAAAFTRLQQETREFVSNLRELELNLNLNLGPQPNEKRAIYNLAQIQSLCDLNLEVEFTRASSKRPANNNNSSNIDKTPRGDLYGSQKLEAINKKRISLEKSLKQTNSSLKTLSTSVRSSIACAMVSWRQMPEKMRLLVDPLLDSIEIEDDILLQEKSITYLVDLIDILCTNQEDGAVKHSGLIDSIIDRLIDVLSSKTLTSMFEFDEPLVTLAQGSPRCSLDAGKRLSTTDAHKIVMLDNLQRKAEQTRSLARRQSSANPTSGGSIKRLAAAAASSEQLDCETHEEVAKRSTAESLASEVRLRGARISLGRLAEHFGKSLPERLPKLWHSLTSSMKQLIEEHKPTLEDSSQVAQDKQSPMNEIQLIRSLRLLESVGKSIDKQLAGHLLELYGHLISLLPSANPLVRHHSGQCIGVISEQLFEETVEQISNGIIPMLYQSDNILARCGAIEAIALIIEHLQLELVPRVDMLIIHVLRRMSDQNDQVRLMATHCFGRLLSLMPLNLEKSATEKGDAKVKVERNSPAHDSTIRALDEGKFIEQLLDPKKLEEFKCPFEMSCELRSYQQDGLNWLAFLNRYNLHGILCDEMGLGKTLMTICMVASDHKQQLQGSSCVQAPEPSLIVCPPTLTGHWLYELDKFLPIDLSKSLNPVIYSGTTSERANLRYQITNRKLENAINLVIASYDIVRNDIDFFKDINWNYSVLDEGHIIKNGRTKLSRAIRLLTARHRLILSGTPIQNNVTELWSLFDFLMPGFLGSERQFNSRFAKPILQSREPKCSARELEAGALAMESLHRQVLPFILRRLKEDVLDDLPPKIIQDYYCELSWLQQKLYEDFTKSKLCEGTTKPTIRRLGLDEEPEVGQPAGEKQKSHVFQALQYLKNVCNHPKLVLTERHSQYQEIKRSLDQQKGSLDDISHSSKLKALRQLLIDCGIGPSSQASDEPVVAGSTMAAGQQQQQQVVGAGSEVESVVNQHRALIFCQVRAMVNIVENDLLKRHLPSITYLKLDGSVPSSQRHAIVSRFNNDPSIDVLLLTTQIGGLGLNLTGADTVIFIEHDWNPTKDLQAMDRAHRIGQKKVVNVYRLITKGTLEEKIMGLQKFKTMVSNTVINQDNAGLSTMNADQLLDLFEAAPARQLSGSHAIGMDSATANSQAQRAGFMELLPELWDQQQYDTEYDLSSFVASIKN